VPAATTSSLASGAEAVLRAGWRQGRRDGIPYGFTCPAPRKYAHQWYWDSCFHAIAWRRYDQARAREELRTLVRAMQPDGLIPHTIFWHAPARWRRAPLYATLSSFGSLGTAHTQTPVIALAWELVADGDPEFAAEGVEPLRSHFDWLQRERDPDGDGLISIIHPDESGLDDSPKYDPVWRRMAHHRPGYFWLVQRSRRLGYSSSAILDRYHEHVEDVLVNVFYALSLRSLARLSGDDEYTHRAEKAERALLELCYDERSGLFYDVAFPSERRIEVSTWSSLAPLALESIPEEVKRRLVEEHLLHPRRYGAKVGIPSVSMEEPSFRPGFDRWRCWRGPAWVNTAWLLVPPMRELGYEAEAAAIVDSLAAAVARDGFREYYNPLTGSGLAARDFGWSTLIVDLMDA
jgi:Glycosyl hydrolase family 63 C-terminal domain